MIIYLCIKFQSNTPISSKDIARKPFVLRTGRTGRTYVLYAPPHWKWQRHKKGSWLSYFLGIPHYGWYAHFISGWDRERKHMTWNGETFNYDLMWTEMNILYTHRSGKPRCLQGLILEISGRQSPGFMLPLNRQSEILWPFMRNTRVFGHVKCQNRTVCSFWLSTITVNVVVLGIRNCPWESTDCTR